MFSLILKQYTLESPSKIVFIFTIIYILSRNDIVSILLYVIGSHERFLPVHGSVRGISFVMRCCPENRPRLPWHEFYPDLHSIQGTYPVGRVRLYQGKSYLRSRSAELPACVCFTGRSIVNRVQ